MPFIVSGVSSKRPQYQVLVYQRHDAFNDLYRSVVRKVTEIHGFSDGTEVISFFTKGDDKKTTVTFVAMVPVLPHQQAFGIPSMIFRLEKIVVTVASSEEAILPATEVLLKRSARNWVEYLTSTEGNALTRCDYMETFYGEGRRVIAIKYYGVFGWTIDFLKEVRGSVEFRKQLHRNFTTEPALSTNKSGNAIVIAGLVKDPFTQQTFCQINEYLYVRKNWVQAREAKIAIDGESLKLSCLENGQGKTKLYEITVMSKEGRPKSFYANFQRNGIAINTKE